MKCTGRRCLHAGGLPETHEYDHLFVHMFHHVFSTLSLFDKLT